eukprot:TRINITY_DN23995_c0_g1_i1.p1 TRINITY_DN23995_c0_g1~~TRINITY_DN23995_c0_g1_i1.p1  ORF type:complete len:581 (+),score=147.87 TRINITY_DN23995_c0_g1_i1:81-1823(+)
MATEVTRQLQVTAKLDMLRRAAAEVVSPAALHRAAAEIALLSPRSWAAGGDGAPQASPSDVFGLSPSPEAPAGVARRVSPHRASPPPPLPQGAPPTVTPLQRRSPSAQCDTAAATSPGPPSGSPPSSRRGAQGDPDGGGAPQRHGASAAALRTAVELAVAPLRERLFNQNLALWQAVREMGDRLGRISDKAAEASAANTPLGERVAALEAEVRELRSALQQRQQQQQHLPAVERAAPSQSAATVHESAAALESRVAERLAELERRLGGGPSAAPRRSSQKPPAATESGAPQRPPAPEDDISPPRESPSSAGGGSGGEHGGGGSPSLGVSPQTLGAATPAQQQQQQPGPAKAPAALPAVAPPPLSPRSAPPLSPGQSSIPPAPAAAAERGATGSPSSAPAGPGPPGGPRTAGTAQRAAQAQGLPRASESAGWWAASPQRQWAQAAEWASGYGSAGSPGSSPPRLPADERPYSRPLGRVLSGGSPGVRPSRRSGSADDSLAAEVRRLREVARETERQAQSLGGGQSGLYAEAAARRARADLRDAQRIAAQGRRRTPSPSAYSLVARARSELERAAGCLPRAP